jgi:hypothetical protein
LQHKAQVAEAEACALNCTVPTKLALLATNAMRLRSAFAPSAKEALWRCKRSVKCTHQSNLPPSALIRGTCEKKCLLKKKGICVCFIVLLIHYI